MIEIRYHQKSNSIECLGHAGYGEKGKDIVCASVTALCLTLGKFVDSTAKGGEIKFDEGHIIVKSVPPSRLRALTRLVYGIFAVGLKSIAEEYPDNVHFEAYE